MLIPQQIIGFDFLLLEPDARPVLLEVNSNPSLRTDALHSFLSRSTFCSEAPESTTSPDLSPPHLPKHLTRAFSPCGPVAEAATLLSCMLGDRYAQFERSAVDECIKGGLIKATLKLMAARIRDRRTKRNPYGESAKDNHSNLFTRIPSTTANQIGSTRFTVSSVKSVQLPILVHSPEKNDLDKHPSTHPSPRWARTTSDMCTLDKVIQGNDSNEIMSSSSEYQILKITTPKSQNTPTVYDRTDCFFISSDHNSNALKNEK